MRYLQKYQEFGKINEADGIDTTKLQITVQFTGYKVGEKYKKGIVASCTFNYDGKPLTTTPMNFTFIDSEDRFIYSTNEAIKVGSATISGPFKMGVLKKTIDASGKAVIGTYGAENTTWALYLNKKGSAWMAQGVVLPGGSDDVPIPTFEKNLGAFFAPNVDVIDDAKKAEVNAILEELSAFYAKNKPALTAPLANEKKYKFQIVGGASQVSTTYAGGNNALAQKRADNLKKYMMDYFKSKNMNDVYMFVVNAEVAKPVIGVTPYKGGEDLKNPELAKKYASEQFVTMSIKTR